MYDIYKELKAWMRSGHRVALATVVKTWGSSPREMGAKMAVNEAGEMVGSVSGGCVEGAVVERALEVLRGGQPEYLHFGVADEMAWEVGLACGGEIDILVHLLDERLFERQVEAIDQAKMFGTLTNLADGEQGLCVDGGETDCFNEKPAEVVEIAAEMFRNGVTGVIQGSGLEETYFLDVQKPQPRLVIVGGAHISIALVRIANIMGYQTIVVDPRSAFGSEARFPEADQLVQAWPDEALSKMDINHSTAIAVLSHDPKLDDPALLAALNTNAFYIGALGSKGTQAKRHQRLLKAGVSEAQIDRIYGPIGLKLGGRTPEEIALAVMAEIVKARNG